MPQPLESIHNCTGDNKIEELLLVERKYVPQLSCQLSYIIFLKMHKQLSQQKNSVFSETA